MPPTAKLNASRMKRTLGQRQKYRAAPGEEKRPGYWGGTGIQAGTLFSDRDRTRRSPSPPEVVELYRSLVYTCTRINYNAFSEQQLRLYRTTKRGQSKGHLKSWQVDSVPRKQIEYMRKSGHIANEMKGVQEIEEIVDLDFPLLRAVTDVNKQWDHTALMRYTSACLDLFGRSHWWMESYTGARTDNVWPLLTQFVYPWRDGEKYSLIDYFSYGAMRLPYDDVMEVRDVAMRDPYALGVAPAEAAFAHSDLFDMFISYERNVFEQGAAPKMLVFNKDPEMPMGRVERERLQRDINYGLVRGQQGIAWVVDGNLDVKPMSFLPEGMAKLGIGAESLARVANAFLVPVSFLDITTSNRSTSESDRKLHAEICISPRCALVGSAFTKWTRKRGKMIDESLKARGSSVTSNHNRLLWMFDNPVPEDQERHQKVIDMQLARGQRTINQINAEEGLPAVEWGNEPWFNMNLIQPSVAEEQRQWSRQQQETKLAMTAAQPAAPGKPGKKPGRSGGTDAADGTPGAATPALPKPAPDEYEDPGQEVVIPNAGTSKPKAGDGHYAKLSAKRAARKPHWADEWDLAESLLRAALLEMGLGAEESYEDVVMTPKERIDALHVLRIQCADAMRKMAERTNAELEEQEETIGKALGSKAKEVVDRFFKSARRFVRATAVASALLVFGPGEASDAEVKAIEKAQTVQEAYLDGFRRRVYDGDGTLSGQFVSNAEMYGRAVWGTGANMLRDVAIDKDVFTEEMREHVGDDVPCDTCVEQVDLGWQPIGTLLSIGDSECCNGCHCMYVFRDVDGTEWTAGRGPLEEIAFGVTG